MASFDFVEAATSGYNFVWDKREIALRLAMIPFVVKLASFFFVVTFDFQDNLLRQGLVLLPSYFLEGFLVAQLIRMAILNEAPWTNMNQIYVGTIVYTLIKLGLSVFVGVFMMSAATQTPPPPSSEPSAALFLAAMALFVFVIWSFRLFWLHVPAVLGYDMLDFLRRIKPLIASAYMIGTWLLCFVPTMLFLMIFSQILITAFPGAGEEESMIYTYGIAAIQAALEIFIAVLSSVAMAFGIQTIYDGTNKPTPLL